jgi:predicted dithiol-disulfide oxidoreductase (DUF899 family)
VPLKRGAMNPSFPGESAEYRAARDRQLELEIELRRGAYDMKSRSSEMRMESV